MAEKSWVCKFEKPKGNPATFDPEPATTVLSPYLKFGCVSPRLFYQKLLEVYAKDPSHSKPPVSLEGQLLWREFFYAVGYDTPNFDKVCQEICVRCKTNGNELSGHTPIFPVESRLGRFWQFEKFKQFPSISSLHGPLSVRPVS
jgi:hypothetical protein